MKGDWARQRAICESDRRKLIASYNAIRIERDSLLDRVAQLEALLSAVCKIENERKVS